MSDKYYLQECNSYTHCCQNTYRIERRDILNIIDIPEQQEQEKQKQRTWWQRLWEQDAQEVRA